MPHPARGRLDSGAAAAWTEELFAEHGRMVAGLCRLLVRDATEAEDAAQQTFLSAHRALLNGSVPREPAPWLAAIARNECLARTRSRMREPLLLGETEPAAAASDALSEAIRRADLAALWRAIDALPAPQRDALLLRELGGLSYEELAAALAVSRSAVESLLFRARRGLRERLGEAYAGVAGAGWLEALGRLFAAGSGAAAPVAAKVAVVAVVAGGALVTPDLLQHHRPPVRASPVRVRAAPRPRPRANAAAAAAAVVAPAAPAPSRHAAQRVVLAVRHEDRRGARTRKDDGSGDRGDRAAVSAPPVAPPPDGPVREVSDDGSGDRGGATDDGPDGGGGGGGD